MDGANGLINGFSQTHVSGTGCGAKYGNILVQPTVGEVDWANHSSDRGDERATTGFYGVTLTRYKVGVEIAVARRSAIYRFTFPATDKANVLVDAGYFLTSFRNQKEAQKLCNRELPFFPRTEVNGFSSITGGWGYQKTMYTVTSMR